jgi:hypothetical protein
MLYVKRSHFVLMQLPCRSFLLIALALVAGRCGSPRMSRLANIGRRKYISVSGLADVLKDIRHNGMPSSISRSSIKRARDQEFDEYDTSYGTLIKQVTAGTDDDGNPCTFWFADPRACLHYMITQSPKLAAFFQEKLAANPCSINNPWSIVVYNDEITPGDQLQHHNARKTQAFYYSFLEFGAEALSSEFLWFTLSATRSDDVSEISGLSFGIFAKVQMMAFEAWSNIGFQCGSIIIWAKVKLFVADESAIKFTLDVKGASGNLPCFKCRNCLSKKTFAKTRPNSDLLSITDIDYEAFLKHDDNSLKANAQFLAEQKSVLKKIQFEKLQTSLGLNYNPDGIILSGLDFMPISGTCYDPQHVLLVNGVFNSEVGQLIVVLKSMKITISDMASFFQSFNWPFQSKSGNNLFDHRSNSSITDKGKTPSAELSSLRCTWCFWVASRVRHVEGVS